MLFWNLMFFHLKLSLFSICGNNSIWKVCATNSKSVGVNVGVCHVLYKVPDWKLWYMCSFHLCKVIRLGNCDVWQKSRICLKKCWTDDLIMCVFCDIENLWVITWKFLKSIVIKSQSERDKLVKVQFPGSMEFSMLTIVWKTKLTYRVTKNNVLNVCSFSLGGDTHERVYS